MIVMKRFLAIFLALCLLSLATNARKHKEVLQEQVQTAQQRQTVVEANHYASNTQAKHSYDINELQKGKPLLFILKPHSAESNDVTLQANPITVTIKVGSDSKQCVFNSYTQLCVLPKIQAQKGLYDFECKKTPCELSWMLIQPAISLEDGDHSIDNLVSINKDKNHAALRVYCNNPDLTESFDESLVLYTNSKYTRIMSSNRQVALAFFLFDNQEEGYYYLTSTDEKVRECVNSSLQHMDDDIAFNSEKDIFRDFLEPGISNTYEFKSIPSQDFRVEANAYDLAMNELTNDTSIKVAVNGWVGGKKKVLKTLILRVDIEKTSINFNAVFKKPSEKYDKMQFQFQATGQVLMFMARFVSAEVQEVNLGELSFFDLQKGQTIKYRLVPLEKDIEGIDKIHILPSSSNIKVSSDTCPSTGCEFTVEALEKEQGNIYIGEGQTRNISEIIIQEFQKSITSKIGPAQQLYFKYKVKANQALQLLINVPSAIVFAATTSKCPEVNDKCFEVSFNHHFPAIYEPKEDGVLVFKVVGLDNCQFTLTVIDEKTPFIELKDTEPFTYLFDDKEKQLIFQFKMPQKEDVSFNLIGPANELNLLVLNQDKPAVDSKKDWSSAEVSADGFIKYSKDQIKGEAFAIKVEKRQQFQNKYAHFTIIASTKQANLRLQSGAAHYQTLKAKDTRDYVFQFSPSSRTILNFYTHNIHKNVNISLKLSNADEYNNPQNTAQFTIDKYVDVLDLGLASGRLCKENEGQNCQLFVRLENMMGVQIDVTITLVTDNSIIELKDGIWQSYAVNDVTSSSHFYFLPKHINHSATIFYKPSIVDLRIVYSIWKSDDLSINPSEWPFPTTLEQPGKRFEFKPLQYVHVEPQKLKACWPNCVILMSMITDSKAFQEAVQRNQSVIDAQFRIMASNNYIQIPEKHKVDVLLSKNQTKQLLVDLKYSLEKEQVTFYTHHTIGNAKIKANVYSQTNPRCPTVDDPADFDFEAAETSIQIEAIKKKMSENSMEGDKNIYLCLLAQADQNSKFNIEFNSNAEGYHKLGIDTTTTLKTSSKQTLYYMDNSQEIYLKMTRDQGFPYYATKLCKEQEGLSKCFEEFAQAKEEGTQLANKVTTLAEKPCPKCILLIKITAKEQTQLVLHTQSKFTQLELTAGSIVSDSLPANEQNRYTITGTRDEEIIINIQIISGDLKVGVHDFEKVDLIKTNTKGSKNIHITVPPKDLTAAEKELGVTHMSSFGMSSFVHLHVTIESQDHNLPASYSITYSSGQPVVYLQDGLITQYNLISKKETKFIYKNPANSPIYLYSSAPDVESLRKLKIEYYTLDNLEDEDEVTSIKPSKDDFQKKTANPTHFAMLPAKSAYIFKIVNQNDKNTIFTIGINNREIIYLPFDHEFPIELAPKEYMYLVLNSAVAGYVKVTFSKCAISYPYIGYTTDYDQFIKEDYSIEDQMSQDLASDLVLKVKQASSLYIKVRSSDTESTVMTIKAAFSPNKIKPGRAKPGDKGLIQYQLLDSTKAELTFSTLVCDDGKACNKDYSYSAISSDKIDSIYAQLMCPSIMFSTSSIRQLKAATVTPITTTPSSNKITFTQSISQDIEYVGVKAVNSKTGEVVYYQPVQIVTFWGELHRSTGTTVILISLIVIVFGCGCLMVYRRYKKNEYRPLGEMNDAIDRD